MTILFVSPQPANYLTRNNREFAKIKEFIERLNKKFVTPDKTRTALLQFGEPVKTRIGEKNTLVNKGVADMTYLRLQTATADPTAREEVMVIAAELLHTRQRIFFA